MCFEPWRPFIKLSSSREEILHLEKFQFQIIWKPFDPSTTNLVLWYNMLQEFLLCILPWPWLKVKGPISRSNRKLGEPVFISYNLFEPDLWKVYSSTQVAMALMMTLLKGQSHRSRSNFLKIGKILNNCQYLGCYFTHILHTWYQGIT